MRRHGADLIPLGPRLRPVCLQQVPSLPCLLFPPSHGLALSCSLAQHGSTPVLEKRVRLLSLLPPWPLSAERLSRSPPHSGLPPPRKPPNHRRPRVPVITPEADASDRLQPRCGSWPCRPAAQGRTTCRLRVRGGCRRGVQIRELTDGPIAICGAGIENAGFLGFEILILVARLHRVRLTATRPRFSPGISPPCRTLLALITLHTAGPEMVLQYM